LHRFQDREDTPYKRYKITDEDWRNREKWPEYKSAVNEMVARTSTEHAPWTLVEGDDKPYARVKVLTTVCDAMRKALKNEKGKFTPAGVTRCGDQIANDKD
jgi:AMP-polyphosphate phosphotransferase